MATTGKCTEYSFSSWWLKLSSMERERVNTDLAKLCNVAQRSVLSWGYGYRNPRPRIFSTIEDYLRGLGVSCENLFPDSPDTRKA